MNLRTGFGDVFSRRSHLPLPQISKNNSARLHRNVENVRLTCCLSSPEIISDPNDAARYCRKDQNVLWNSSVSVVFRRARRNKKIYLIVYSLSDISNSIRFSISCWRDLHITTIGICSTKAIQRGDFIDELSFGRPFYHLINRLIPYFLSFILVADLVIIRIIIINILAIALSAFALFFLRYKLSFVTAFCASALVFSLPGAQQAVFLGMMLPIEIGNLLALKRGYLGLLIMGLV